MRSDSSHISPAKGWQLDYARLAKRRREEHLIGFRLRAGFRFCHPYLLICRTDFLGHILWEQCVKISVNAQRSHLTLMLARSLTPLSFPLFCSRLCVGVKKLIFAATERERTNVLPDMGMVSFYKTPLFPHRSPFHPLPVYPLPAGWQ